MHTSAFDICVIEDDPLQRALVVGQLVAGGYRDFEADSGEGGLQAIHQHRPRIAICDVHLPDMTGIDVCRRIRSDSALDSIFVILITGHDEEGRHSAFEAGADDYLRKPYDLDQVRARVRSGLRFHRLQERLRHAAITDGLTGLWNHSHFRDLLEREFVRTRRYGGVASLIMMDLDHFKAINDTFGHETGSAVLKQTARHLERQARETDLIARYGGEAFAVICPETRLEEAGQLAERIRRTLPQSVRSCEHPQLAVRASFGVAGSDDPRAHAHADLVNLADRALYASKRAGRDRVTAASIHAQILEAAEEPIGEVDRLRKEIVGLTMQTKELCLQSVWALIQALE